MRLNCCGGFAAKAEQLARGRIEHQAFRTPACQPARSDQRNDANRTDDQERAAQHAAHCGETAIHASELMLDFLRSLTQLLTLHGDARQQIAVMVMELIVPLAHFGCPTRARRLSRSFASSASVSSSIGDFSRSFLRSTSTAKIASPTNM